LTLEFAAEFAGLEVVNFAELGHNPREGCAGTLTLTNEAIHAHANGNEDYRLHIEGNNNDTLDIDLVEFTRTGRKDVGETTYDEYESSSGNLGGGLLVGKGVRVIRPGLPPRPLLRRHTRSPDRPRASDRASRSSASPEVARLQAAPSALAMTPDPERGLSRHPTFGLWPVDLRDDLRAALRSGTRKVVAWTEPHGCARAVFDIDGHDPFFNVNTPEDLARAERMLALE